jgi:hypothetical protein
MTTTVQMEKINNTFIDDEEFNVNDKDSDNKQRPSISGSVHTDKEDNIIDLDKIYDNNSASNNSAINNSASNNNNNNNNININNSNNSNNSNNNNNNNNSNSNSNNNNNNSKKRIIHNTQNNTEVTLIDIEETITEETDEPTASRDNDDSDNNKTQQTLKKIGSKTFRTQIMKQYIRPRMERDIKDSITWRDKWGTISNIFFSFSELLCIIQTVMAFTASSYDLKLLSFLAGMLGVLGISFNRFATYARNASSEKTSQLNEILGTIGIKDIVPDLMDNDYGDGDRRGSKIK